MTVIMSKDERIAALEAKCEDLGKYNFSLNDRIHTLLHKVAYNQEAIHTLTQRLDDYEAKFEVIEEMLGEIES